MAWLSRRRNAAASETTNLETPRTALVGTMVTGTSEAAREGRRTSDLTIAALGITLGLICALFPWYIVLNPEQFGPPEVKFQGGGAPVSGPVAVGPQPQRIGAPMNLDEVPVMDLDLFATGTLPDKSSEHEGADTPPGLDQQPFPVQVPQFRLVHVANGRAMIADDAGLWVVQRGSVLPDSSTVARIEERGSKWVIVTSDDRVVEMTP